MNTSGLQKYYDTDQVSNKWTIIFNSIFGDLTSPRHKMNAANKISFRPCAHTNMQLNTRSHSLNNNINCMIYIFFYQQERSLERAVPKVQIAHKQMLTNRLTHSRHCMRRLPIVRMLSHSHTMHFLR